MLRFIGTAIAIAATAGMLLLPIVAGEAIAKDGDPCSTDSECQPPATAKCVEDTSNGGLNGSFCTPEMSDYMAMAFIVVAGGIAFRLRRRVLAKA